MPKRYSSTIPEWPVDERPRERLLNNGAHILSSAELLAIILRTGNKNSTSVDLARYLLNKFGGLRGLDCQSTRILSKIDGIGDAKAAQIKAALELSKRLAREKSRVADQVFCAEDVYRLVYLHMRDLNREQFRVLFLTGRNDILAEKTLFTGSLTESVVSPREIILEAIQQAAASLILLHNHPSGNPSPSPEDKKITEKIVSACRFFDISVLDHIIVGKDSFYSFADHGQIES